MNKLRQKMLQIACELAYFRRKCLTRVFVWTFKYTTHAPHYKDSHSNKISTNNWLAVYGPSAEVLMNLVFYCFVCTPIFELLLWVGSSASELFEGLVCAGRLTCPGLCFRFSALRNVIRTFEFSFS